LTSSMRHGFPHTLQARQRNRRKRKSEARSEGTGLSESSYLYGLISTPNGRRRILRLLAMHASKYPDSTLQAVQAEIRARSQANQRGTPSINSIAPSRPTVIMASPRVLVANPASQYVK
jgi:hypothetical protein